MTHQLEFYKSMYEWIHKVSLFVCISFLYWVLNAMRTKSNSTSVYGICRQHYLQNFFSCLVELSSLVKRNSQDLRLLPCTLFLTVNFPYRLGILWVSCHILFQQDSRKNTSPTSDSPDDNCAHAPLTTVMWFSNLWIWRLTGIKPQPGKKSGEVHQ